MSKPNSQYQRILIALLGGDKLTPLDALRRFGCFRLGARVWEMKRRGWPVQAERITQNGKSYASYYIQENGNG